MPRTFMEQQLSALLVISTMLGVALLTVALFALHHAQVPPYLPFVLSASGLLLLAASALIGVIRGCMHR